MSNNELKVAQAQIAELKAALVRAKSEVAALEAANSDSQEIIFSLKGRNRTNNATIDSLADQIAEARAEVAVARAELEQQRKVADGARRQKKVPPMPPHDVRELKAAIGCILIALEALITKDKKGASLFSTDTRGGCNSFLETWEVHLNRARDYLDVVGKEVDDE